MYSKAEAIKIRKEFWVAFGAYTQFLSKKNGRPINWMLYKTGIKGLELKFDVLNQSVIVRLEVNEKNEERQFDIYAELDNYKLIIEQGYENGLKWDDAYILPEGKKVSCIYIEWENITFHNRDNWPDIFKFMADNMLMLQSNFEDIQDIFIDKFSS